MSKQESCLPSRPQAGEEEAGEGGGELQVGEELVTWGGPTPPPALSRRHDEDHTITLTIITMSRDPGEGQYHHLPGLEGTRRSTQTITDGPFP